MATESGVFVGCSYPSTRVLTRRRYQAVCSCGWEGRRRRALGVAGGDLSEHLARGGPRPFAADRDQERDR